MTSNDEPSQYADMNLTLMNHNSIFMPLEMVLPGWARNAVYLICRKSVNVCGPRVSTSRPLRIHGWLGLGGGSDSAQWCVLGFREGWVWTYRVSRM